MENTYEIICEECGKAFESNDEAATVCPECWEKLINLSNEGKGDNTKK